MEKFNRVLHLSRSVHFDCTITIDQLINIPLLNGRFKIKWKFSQPTQEQATATATHPTTTNASQAIEHNHPDFHPTLESNLSGPSSTHLVELPIKAEPSGATDYHEIKNHSVIFRHAFHCPISINLDKQAVLQPSILSIIIKEEHVNELGRRVVSRHGSVDIDLSQYTPIMNIEEEHSHHHYHHNNSSNNNNNNNNNSSRIEKAKFLLRECKTNASLKLQIQMDYLGGMTPFKIAKSLGTISTTNISGPYVELQMARVPSQSDDARSIFNSRQSNTRSPGSSIISSGSSQHKFSMTSNKPSGLSTTKLHGAGTGLPLQHQQQQAMMQTQPMPKLSSHSGLLGTHHDQPHHDHPQDITSQLAKNVIDTIFANPTILTPTPAPSSATKNRRTVHHLNSQKKNSTKRSVKSSRFY